MLRKPPLFLDIAFKVFVTKVLRPFFWIIKIPIFPARGDLTGNADDISSNVWVARIIDLRG